MKVYKPEESDREVTMLKCGVTVEVTVEEAIVLQAGAQQGWQLQ